MGGVLGGLITFSANYESEASTVRRALAIYPSEASHQHQHPHLHLHKLSSSFFCGGGSRSVVLMFTFDVRLWGKEGEGG